MNARVGDNKVEGVVGKFGLPGSNENGRKLTELYTGKKLSVGNTFLGGTDTHHLTWVRGGDLTVVQEEERHKLLSVNVFRNTGGEISEHQLVVAKIRYSRR